MDVDNTDAAAHGDTDESAETSSNATPGTNTPTGSVVVPSRDRSGTVIARPVWDPAPNGTANTTHTRRSHRARPAMTDDSRGASTSTSADNSRPETETEDDGDVDMDRESSPATERHDSTDTATIRASVHPRRAVGIVSDTAPAAQAGASLDMNTDAHIIINDDQSVAVEGVGVEDGIVSLETNDDFAMGAPPGAPGAIDGPPRNVTDTHTGAGERTPRAGTATLPLIIPNQPVPATARTEAGGARTTGAQRAHPSRGTNTPTATGATAGSGSAETHRHSRDETGPYRDEDVLLGLQLLAYLSKYPHVRQAFYKQRPSFHPATAQLYSGGNQPVAGPSGSGSGSKAASAGSSVTPTKEPNSFMKAFQSATGRGKEKEKASTPAATPANPQRMTNVFALVERFTFRPSSSDVDSANAPPTLPPEIQYWAGVIMRNACRKDDSRGGIRQCANSECLH